jgi:hypothetical protein
MLARDEQDLNLRGKIPSDTTDCGCVGDAQLAISGNYVLETMKNQFVQNFLPNRGVSDPSNPTGVTSIVKHTCLQLLGPGKALITQQYHQNLFLIS